MLLPSGARLEKWVKIGNFLVHARAASSRVGGEDACVMGSMKDGQAVFPACMGCVAAGKRGRRQS